MFLRYCQTCKITVAGKSRSIVCLKCNHSELGKPVSEFEPPKHKEVKQYQIKEKP